ncbi:hypothetical protein BGZ63DRAFT_356072 [Mariannaea sp. PMI_226]|nr:hypothetical protein BGZ63DRAFT_356072 [Mariannaea sp. PMI_226]
MNRELQELRSIKDSSDHPGSAFSRTTDSASPALDVREDAEDDFDFQNAIVSLDNIFLDPLMAVEAFQIFADVFHPQLPILGPLSINRIHETQPLLFWTIIVIVMNRWHRADFAAFLTQLRDPFVKYFQQQMLQAPLPLYKIQAITLLIQWPLEVSIQSLDPSWLYCGTIIQAARFMSLDRHQMVPSLRSLGVAAGNIQARVNSWLGCFYVATSLSMHLGLPAPIDSDLDLAAIHEFLRRYKSSISSTFAAKVRVYLIVAKFMSLLNRDIGETISSSFLRLLDTELAALHSDTMDNGEVSKAVELYILDTKLHFYTLAITKISHDSSSRSIMLTTALSAALRIIHTSTSTWRDYPEVKGSLSFIQKQRSLPKSHYRGFAFATIFLIRFFHNSDTASLDEKQLAANHIQLAREHFKACSTSPHDEFSRTREVFEVLSRLKPMEAETKKLRLTHRMGVSIILDALTNASEVRGKPTKIEEQDKLESDDVSDRHDSIGANLDDFYDSQVSMDQAGMNVDLLRGLWTDPILNMLNFEPMPDLQYF